jgi:predicted transcriptional regulator
MLIEIENHPMRLSEVGRMLSITVQEASRQLDRLAEAKLVSKNPESKFEITSFGRAALALLPSFRFIELNRDFILSHDLSGLPTPFVHRLGELSGARPINQLDQAIAHAEEVVTGARKYVWLLSDQSMRQSYPHEHPAEVEFRSIFPKDIDPEIVKRIRSRIGPSLQVARLDKVKLSLAMNETTAAVCFPDLQGRMDFTRGFAGEDHDFHAWCHDLYESFWDGAREESERNL